VSILIEADDLFEALASPRPPVVADVRWILGGPPGLSQFEAGHLPEAQWVSLETELSAPPGPGGRHPLPAPEVFQAAMRRIGVGVDTAVVVCDGANALAAARLWWMLTDASDLPVRVLNGGVAAWDAAGLPIERGPAKSTPSGDFVASPGRRRQVDGDELAALLTAEPGRVVVDARAPERYSGATEPIDAVAGHIPGAVNLPSLDNLDGDGRFLTPELLTERYAAAGVGDSSVVYCGSGITAAHTLLALDQVGVRGAAIYPGSWSDWITDAARPVATGETP